MKHEVLFERIGGNGLNRCIRPILNGSVISKLRMNNLPVHIM